jgi:predicted nucleic acid-binding Zn ribbon protein
MSSKSLKKCKECGKMTLQRLIGAGAGVIFKGSGFYQTDYRSESYKEGKKKSKEAAKKKDTTKKSEKKDTKKKSSDKPKPTKGSDKSKS